jgi:DNA-binding NtrC family response regulator
MADILVVDDDQSIAAAFERFLKHEGHDYVLASNAEEAVRLVEERQPDLVLMDIRMPGVDGLHALQQMRSSRPDLMVVMMTAYGTSQTSIDAIRSGAFEYLTKPLDLDQLRSVIRRAVAAKSSRDKAPADQEPAPPTVALVGDAPAMQEVYKMIGRLVTIDVPALIVGERGTGKELVVATIHGNSARRESPFVSLDCATSDENVLERALFGDAAGTLHLSDVHALPRPLQARLARALTEGAARGASKLQPRVIASTDRDLVDQVASGAFSRELYETLSVIVIHLPPLRERREDVPLLVRHFLQRFNEELSRTIRAVDEEVLRRLQEYSWPGNVAELETVVKRACIVARGDVVTIEDVAGSLTGERRPGRDDADSSLCKAVKVALQEQLVETPSSRSSSVFHEIVRLVEGTLVKEALAITNGNQVKASELLGVNRATLRKKASE